jgi:hypothetical protein
VQFYVYLREAATAPDQQQKTVDKLKELAERVAMFSS